MPLLSARSFNDPYTQDELEAAPGDVSSAVFEQAKADLPLSSMIRLGDMSSAREGWRIGGVENAKSKTNLLDRAAATAYMAERGLEGQFQIDRDYYESELEILAERKREELKRADLMSRSQSGFFRGAGKFGISLATQFLDPLAIGANFVPVVREARYANMLRTAGSALGRAGVRAGVGAAEGATGAALLEPLTYAAHRQEQADYQLADSLANIGLGTVLGGGLHVAGGALADIGRGTREARIKAQDDAIAAALDSRRAAWQAIADRTSELSAIAPRTDLEPTERLLRVSDVESSVSRLYERRRAELEAIGRERLTADQEVALRGELDDASRAASRIDDNADPEGAAMLDQRVRDLQDRLNAGVRSELADAELRKLDSAWNRAKSAKDRAGIVNGEDAPIWQQLDLAEKADQLEAIESRVADLEQRRPAVEAELRKAEQELQESTGPFAEARRTEAETRARDANRELRKIDGYLFQLRPLREDLSRAVQNAPRITVYKAAPQERRAALQAGMAQVQSGSPIEVRPAFDRSPETMQAAAKRLSDPGQQDLADPAAVERADATIAEGETAEVSAVQKESEALDAEIKALTDEADVSGDEALITAADEMNASIAEVEALARESTQHARLLAVCAARHAA